MIPMLCVILARKINTSIRGRGKKKQNVEERKVKEGAGEMLGGLPSQQTQATQQPPDVFSRVSSSARTPGPGADPGHV